MTESEYKHARENFDRHCAEREIARIDARVNRAGRYYQYLVRDIFKKYGIEG